MQTAVRTVFLLLLTAALVPTAVHGQKEDLPIDPDSIYSVISSTSEKLLQGEEIPRELSVAEWRADLDTLAARIKRRMPYADAATGTHHLTRRLDSLKRLVPEQTRDQRILSVKRLVNLPAAGTGHTKMRSDQRALGWRAFPLRLYRFDDGAYVMSAANPDLIGAEASLVLC
jgi:hypothetical protein